MKIIGIDPGLSGAIAVLENNKVLNIFEVITEKEDFYKVKIELEKKIDAFEYSSVEWRPLNFIELDKDQSNSVAEVLNSLEDLDDVQNIFTNANLKNLQL